MLLDVGGNVSLRKCFLHIRIVDECNDVSEILTRELDLLAQLLRKIPGLADSGRKECSTPIDVFAGDLLRTSRHRRMATHKGVRLFDATTEHTNAMKQAGLATNGTLDDPRFKPMASWIASRSQRRKSRSTANAISSCCSGR